MKNVIKKIASIAMAFTLLGTGTAITKIIAPQEDNTLVASAASSDDRYGDAKKALIGVRALGETFDVIWGKSGLYKKVQKDGSKAIDGIKKNRDGINEVNDYLKKNFNM